MSSYPLAKPSAHLDRRTKTSATVAPASWDIGVLEQLIAAGADGFRLNFSHAGPDKQAQTIETIRTAADTLGRQVAILGDLPGPKLRIGSIRDDYAELATGMHGTLTTRERERARETSPVSWSGVTNLREDEIVSLADGAIRLRVAERTADGVDAEIEV